MSLIVLTTLNARYSHTSFGLRYLLANMQELRGQSRIVEYTINDHIPEILADLVRLQPKIIGFGVYIWNTVPITQLIADLKQVLPQTIIVVGGPEVSWETESQEITTLADYVITGEADHAFRDLCRELLNGRPPAQKIISAQLPALATLNLPYEEYSAEDVAHRIIYVEASRGCPFTCEFCLSALDIPVRQFPLEQFLQSMQALLDRGVRQFKFVDRTFNLNLRVSQAILQFFLDRLVDGLFLHFELIPDRLPEALKELIVRFPPGTLQFEIGIQTYNEDVGKLISRQQNNPLTDANLDWLRQHSQVHLHTDLIAGLPGETLESFAEGFDRLFRLGPQEIQVGILKRLRGTPILRHTEEWQMLYSRHPPYEILSHRLLSFDQLQSVRRFARFWDLVGNSGNFKDSLRLLLRPPVSPFHEFLRFSEWLFQTEQRRHNIALIRLFERVFQFLTEQQQVDPMIAAQTLWADYTRSGRRDRPEFLRPFNLPAPGSNAASVPRSPDRQRRHLASNEIPAEPA